MSQPGGNTPRGYIQLCSLSLPMSILEYQVIGFDSLPYSKIDINVHIYRHSHQHPRRSLPVIAMLQMLVWVNTWLTVKLTCQQSFWMLVCMTG